jgi:peptide/nickel transport system substrate-binding protein
MPRRVTVVLTAGLMVAGLTAVGSLATGASADASPRAVLDASSGGMLTIGSSVAPPSLDLTSNASAAIDEVLDYNVYQHLVQLDPKGAVVPVLATGDTVSSDGTTYTFTLRQGVKFSNGDPMTAADVVSSLQRADAPKSTYPYGTLLADVTSVTSPNATTVVVTLSKPDNQFLYNLAAYSNGVVLDPSAVGQIATNPVGTGPYVYKSETNNYDVVLDANPGYWGTRPAVSGVTFRYFSSSQAENSALKSGAIQVIDNLSNTSDVSQFTGNSSFKVIHGPTNGKIQLTINNSAGPLAKLKVRQAIAYATDKKAILQTAGDGYGTVIGSDNVPGDPWYLPSIDKTYAYNVAKAKSLLAQAGYPKGFSLTLTLPPYGYATGAGPLIQAELTAIGIKTTIKDVQFPLWLSQVFEASSFSLTIIDHVEARDIANYANCSYYWKYAGCSAAATMLDTATEATTTSAENAGFQALIRKINAEAVNDWLYNPDQVTVAKSDVAGIPGSGLTESFDLSHVSIGGKLSATALAQGYSS